LAHLQVIGAHAFRSRNHPKEMAQTVGFLKGRGILLIGNEAFQNLKFDFERSFSILFFQFQEKRNPEKVYDV
jgi:stage V sporulation protein SpoVS